MRIATITIFVFSLAATAAFAQDPPDPASPPAAAEAPAASPPPAADAQQPAADAQADADRAAERCRQRSTESRLRSSRRQRCPVTLRSVATAPQPNVVAPEEEEEPAQSPTIPPASQQPH